MSVIARKYKYRFFEKIGEVLSTFIKYEPRKIVFIIGTGRCGSTLFHNILTTNKSLCVIPGELNEYFHPDVYPYSKAIENKVPIFYKDPHAYSKYTIDNWNNNAKRLKNFLLCYGLFFGRGKTVVVKSAMISFLLEPIYKSFPNALFIHLYRHAIPVVNSIEKKEWLKYKHYFSNNLDFRIIAAKYWNECLKEIEFQEKKLSKGSFYELSYENLCENSEFVLREVAQFIKTKDDFTFVNISIDKVRSEINDNLKKDKCFEFVIEGLKKKRYINA